MMTEDQVQKEIEKFHRRNVKHKALMSKKEDEISVKSKLNKNFYSDFSPSEPEYEDDFSDIGNLEVDPGREDMDDLII